jgi:type IV secretory pathway TraG/TraD family ATPase VirD4
LALKDIDGLDVKIAPTVVIVLCTTFATNARREYITLAPEAFSDFLHRMQQSHEEHGLVARAANRHLGKVDREAAGVLPTAQRHTHFLSRPRMGQCFRDPTLRSRISSTGRRRSCLSCRPTAPRLMLAGCA